MNDAIKQMLMEIGINDPELVTKQPQIEIPIIKQVVECCGEELTYESQGFLTCWHCGLVKDIAELKYYQKNSTAPTGVSYFSSRNNDNPGMTFYRKRFYKSATHFRDHLNRYMGRGDLARDDPIMDHFKDLDTGDRMLFFVVKKRLKKLKLQNLYKSIFSIIYMSGGQLPNVTNQTFHNCLVQYGALEHYFHQNKDLFGRKSMPSVYMLMDLILRRNGHEPFYVVQQLKDTQLRQKVLDFYVQFDNDVCAPWRCERDDEPNAESFVQDYPDMYVLHQ